MSLTITLRNISNLAEISDYHYEVSVGVKVIESGYVRKHNRSDGWDGLLLLLGSEREVKERYPGPGAAPSRPVRTPQTLLPAAPRKRPTK